MLFPHIANVIVKQFVKPFGTKLFMLIRNPINRLRSGYVHTLKTYNKKETNSARELYQTVSNMSETQRLIKFVNDVNNDSYIKKFISGVKNILDEFDDTQLTQNRSNNNNNNTKTSNMLHKLAILWRNLVYKYGEDNFHSQYYKIWLKSCYAPQVFEYIDAINDQFGYSSGHDNEHDNDSDNPDDKIKIKLKYLNIFQLFNQKHCTIILIKLLHIFDVGCILGIHLAMN